MKQLLMVLLACLGITTLMQAQIGKVGINTNTPAAMLHVKDSSVVFTGPPTVQFPYALPPVNGSGTRMMWYAEKAAFRAGRAVGQQWSKDSIGVYSIAMGYDSRASAEGSLAIGYNIKADGDYSIALGAANKTTGQQSTALGSFLTTHGMWSAAMGVNNVATGSASTVFGSINRASGSYSTAAGRNNVANSAFEFVVGQYNDTTGVASSTGWFDADPLFVIGNGNNGAARKNALTVLKNGNIGFGTSSPQRLLHVSNGSTGVTPFSSSCAVFEDDANVSISLITPSDNSSAIYFGNTISGVAGGIAYNSATINGLDFRTNGNSTKVVIKGDGNMGIGDTSPNARLHVSKGTSGSSYFSTAGVVFEDDSDMFLQFSTPSAEENGLLSASEFTTIRAGLIFRPDSSVQIRTGGNITKFSVDKSGNTNTVGEIRRTSTGSANMVPICYGSVDANGAILSGSGNFTVALTPPGNYELTITGETYTNSGYATNASPVSSNPRFLSIGNTAGKLVVKTWTSAAALVDTAFHFVVYRN